MYLHTQTELLNQLQKGKGSSKHINDFPIYLQNNMLTAARIHDEHTKLKMSEKKKEVDTRDFMKLWMKPRSLESEGTGASAEALIVRGKSDSPLRPLSGSTEPAAASSSSSFGIPPVLCVLCVREKVG